MTRQARRILYIDHTGRLGGGEIALFNLIQAIDRGQFEPVVLLFSEGRLAEKLRAVGVETHVLPLTADIAETRKGEIGVGSLLRVGMLCRTAAFIRLVRGLIARLRPDLVHTNSLKADVIGGFAARLAGVPLIWHVRDRIADDYLSPFAAGAFRWLAERVPAYVIANSTATLKTLSPGTRGTAIPSGVIIGPLPEKSSAAAAPDDAAPAKPLVVGLVGRIAEWKGQHVFLDAIRRLRPAWPAVQFQIIGSALFGEETYEAALHATVAREGLADAVTFTGFQENVASAIAGLDILVHASITGEPLGQVILEGMAAAKPVIATRGGGVPEIITDGDTGLLVRMGDAEALAAAIDRLLADPAERAAMGRRGRKRAAEAFSIEETARRVVEVYEHVLKIGH